MRVLIFIVFVVVSTVSGWITAVRMRRWIRRSLGKHASDIELSSIGPWMKVNEEEERQRGGKLGF